MQDGTNKVNTVKIKEIYDMSWPPNFDSYRELVLIGVFAWAIVTTLAIILILIRHLNKMLL
jgi:hypothetical protein